MVITKTYDDVIKSTIAKTKTWVNEKINQILDKPIGNTAFTTHGLTEPTTLSDILGQAKDNLYLKPRWMGKKRVMVNLMLVLT